jgi:hypothetical protein
MDTTAKEHSVSNGYEIRLELLKMAKDYLDQKYQAQLDMAKHQASLHGTAIVLPEQYSIDDITIKATELNRFVNQKN